MVYFQEQSFYKLLKIQKNQSLVYFGLGGSELLIALIMVFGLKEVTDDIKKDTKSSEVF